MVPELGSQARILKTLGVQGFLSQHFAALLKCFRVMLERQFLIGHTLYDAVNSQLSETEQKNENLTYPFAFTSLFPTTQLLVLGLCRVQGPLRLSAAVEHLAR